MPDTLMEISDVGAFGLNKDLEDYGLDTSIWTTALNVQFEDGKAKTIGGRAEAFQTPIQPIFLMSFFDGTDNYWIWCSQNHIYKYLQGVSTDICGPDDPFIADGAWSWNGSTYNGFAVLNSGTRPPQAWDSSMPKTVRLPNWPADTLAKNVKGFGARLIAINITVNGIIRPHMVKWSHPADPGTLPVSWDPADPTKTAGEYEFPDVRNGVLVDQLELRGQHYLYEESATRRMTLRGDNLVFNFDTFMATAGILAPRCVSLTGDGVKHFLVSQDDVLVHDGVTPVSVLDLKARRYFFNQLNPDQILQTFTFCEPSKKEMWICYVPNGEETPKMALIWNYQTGTISESEIDFACAGEGTYEFVDADLWSTVTSTWDTIERTWGRAVKKAILVGAPTKALRLNVGNTFDGEKVKVILQRTGLSLQGQKRDKKPLSDLTQRMILTRLWPRMRGGPVRVRLGAQDRPQAPIRWSRYQEFNPEVQSFTDLICEGGLPAIEFTSEADVEWKLEGFKLDGALTGRY